MCTALPVPGLKRLSPTALHNKAHFAGSKEVNPLSSQKLVEVRPAKYSCDALERVVSSFTEGRDTADLQAGSGCFRSSGDRVLPRADEPYCSKQYKRQVAVHRSVL